MSEALLALKAGRAFRREGTDLVEPSPTKGAIILTNGDDGLLHFLWKNRGTDEVEEVGALAQFKYDSVADSLQDLILFPSDASFVKVPHSSGRIYVLKFSSSNQRHFVRMPASLRGLVALTFLAVLAAGIL